ncbi:MAG: hypothetical protein O7B32_02530 [Thaumarchaeota archaeon]|nr:hypothetical protein [Nitrososphaerota archaeon]
MDVLTAGYWTIGRIIITTGKSRAVVIMSASFTHPQHSSKASSPSMRSAHVRQPIATAKSLLGFEISRLTFYRSG